MAQTAVAIDSSPGRPLDPDACWTMVKQRDGRFDGLFVFGVATTGVYCRPSCAARRPKRDHVRFFAGPAEAARSGLRPCNRCLPDRPPPARALTAGVRALIEKNDEALPDLGSLGRLLGMSPGHLQRTFKRVMGLTPRQYAEAWRLHELKRSLRDGSSVTQACYDAGFGSSSRVYERAAAMLGMTPGQYRHGGAGRTITYGLRRCAAGYTLIAATGRAICAAAIADCPAALEEDLRREYPAAAFTRCDAILEPAFEVLVAVLERHPQTADLRSEVRASVLRALLQKAVPRLPMPEVSS